ncbi:MAG: DUF1246 domain-containing protein, partial [Nitrososphaerota archaeon]
MISRGDMIRALDEYSPDELCIAVLGSHSALEICRGAKDEGFRTLVICQKGREKTYVRYYISRMRFGRYVGCVDEVVLLERFRD